jgi:hypothetical protein
LGWKVVVIGRMPAMRAQAAAVIRCTGRSERLEKIRPRSAAKAMTHPKRDQRVLE